MGRAGPTGLVPCRPRAEVCLTTVTAL